MVDEPDAFGPQQRHGPQHQHWSDGGPGKDGGRATPSSGRTAGEGKEYRRADGTKWYFPGQRRQGGAKAKTTGGSAGGPFDYRQFREDGGFQDRRGRKFGAGRGAATRRGGGGGNVSSAVSEPRRPPSHQALAVVSSVLFFPLGLCALLHSVRVKRAWDEGRHADARDHSDNARSYAWWACLCFGAVVAYVWLGDGDLDWDWERLKRNMPWDDGP